jgi:ATP synthase protein I
MNDEHRFVSQVVAKAARKLKAQRAAKQPAWFGLGMLGTIGWSVSVPTVAGALLGTWWDRHHPGLHSWTLPLLVAGLVLGCANAWHWISAEEKTLHDSQGSP